MITMTSNDLDDWSIGWYCIRSKPRMENVAATTLSLVDDIEVFLPRTQRNNIKIKQPLKPLFPGYFFARFDPVKHTRNVHFAQGVAYLVKRKEIPVLVPSQVMLELKLLSPDGVLVIPDKPHEVGDKVTAISGLFRGDSGEVTQLIPSRLRIKVLFQILGRDTEIEIDEHEVEFPTDHPIGST